METFSDAHIKELQCPELDHFIQRERALFRCASLWTLREPVDPPGFGRLLDTVRSCRAKKPTIAYSHLIIRTRAFAITLPQQSRNTEV